MANPIGDFGNRKLFDDSEVADQDPIKTFFSAGEELHWPFNDQESACVDEGELQAICDRKILEDAGGRKTPSYCERPFQIWLNLKPCIAATDEKVILVARANSTELSGVRGMPPLPTTFWKFLEEPIPEVLPSVRFGEILDFCENATKSCPVCKGKEFRCPNCDDIIPCPFCKLAKLFWIGNDLLPAKPVLGTFAPIKKSTPRNEIILIQRIEEFSMVATSIINNAGLQTKECTVKCPTTVRFFDQSGRWLAVVAAMIRIPKIEQDITAETVASESYPVLETRQTSTRT